jgi:metallo-beta-lactamase family protein
MLGHYRPVRAEVVALPGLSVHADRGQLLDWLRSAPEPEATYVVHGEVESSASLVAAIESYGWVGVAPRDGERVALGPDLRV